jgi:hypothetical protein
MFTVLAPTGTSQGDQRETSPRTARSRAVIRKLKADAFKHDDISL